MILSIITSLALLTVTHSVDPTAPADAGAGTGTGTALSNDLIAPPASAEGDFDNLTDAFSSTEQEQDAEGAGGVELDLESMDNDSEDQDPNLLSPSEADELTGGGVWSSIGMIAVVICGCICLERLYSSCRKVYMKRTGRYGFSRLHNQTFNEFEDEDDEDEHLGDNTGLGLNTKEELEDQDQDSV